ncbi:MAG: aspartate 1-decarboxylase [Candidatus Marinimicrobia bacterium CG08_land_8_20_14_0_20_45_22]|nr:MAG: aspartate 1-decarboxylase [Candidatus Marinimicrobia bacterium CG08_land_8_20_14_0_20_45_22]
MNIQMLKSKIHRATVTETRLNYEGSITIDHELIAAAHLHINERVQILNINNGSRFDTYVIEGTAGKREICLNGAAARLAQPGDLIIILSYAIVDEKELKNWKPVFVYVDAGNNPV